MRPYAERVVSALRKSLDFPGNGRMSRGDKPQTDEPTIAASRSKVAAPLTPRANGRTEYRGENRAGSEGGASPAQNFITEADIAAKVQNMTGSGPDFDTLLNDPAYDERAKPLPAAREEQE